MDEFASWADSPLSGVTRADARTWFSELGARHSSNTKHRHRKRVLAAQTLRNVLNLVRRAFGDAVEDGLIPSNPFEGLKVHRSRGASTKEKWTVLRPEEQTAAIEAVAAPEKWIIALALGSGIRQGEQRHLHLCDVTVSGPSPSMVIRFGSDEDNEEGDDASGPTKGGDPRVVPLFGLALQAMRAWLLVLPSFAPENPQGLAFPTRAGKLRSRGKTFRSWRHLEKAVGRHVRWHDLRHTCASSLVGGWWGGQAWTLEEVRVLLGHSSIAVTEKYAHFASGTVERAAARMAPPPPPVVTAAAPPLPQFSSDALRAMRELAVAQREQAAGQRALSRAQRNDFLSRMAAQIASMAGETERPPPMGYGFSRRERRGRGARMNGEKVDANSDKGLASELRRGSQVGQATVCKTGTLPLEEYALGSTPSPLGSTPAQVPPAADTVSSIGRARLEELYREAVEQLALARSETAAMRRYLEARTIEPDEFASLDDDGRPLPKPQALVSRIDALENSIAELRMLFRGSR